MKTRKFMLLFVAAGLVAGAIRPASAATAGYNTSTPGLWSTTANWTTSTGTTPYTPAVNDIIHIGSTVSANYSGTATVTLDSGATDMANVYLGYNAGNNGTLTIDGATTSLQALQVIAGLNGSGTLNLTNGGSLNIEANGSLDLRNSVNSVVSAASGTKLTFTAGTTTLYLRNGASFSVPSGVIQLNGSSYHLSSVTMDIGTGAFTQNQDLVVNGNIAMNNAGSSWTVGAHTLKLNAGYITCSGAGTVLDASDPSAKLDMDNVVGNILYLRNGGAINYNAGTFDAGSGARLSNLSLNDSGTAAVAFTQKDATFTLVGTGNCLDMGNTGPATYTVGASHTLVLTGCALVRANGTLNAGDTGARIDAYTAANAEIRAYSGGVVNYVAGTFDTGSGARIRTLTLDGTGTTWTQLDSSFSALNIDVSATSASKYILSAGQALNILAGGTGLRLYDTASTANEFRGVGTVNNARATTGGLFRRGKIVADGGGTDGTLQFNRSVTGQEFTYDAENPTTGDSGYYAVNKGRLQLPAMTTSGAGAITWGDTSTDTSPDMVNSVYFSGWSGLGNGTLTVALLAVDHSSTPAGLQNPVGVWEFTPGTLTFTDVDLTIRYDHVAAGANEVNLKLFAWNGVTWNEITAAGGLDTVNKRISASNMPSGTTRFAVATGAAAAGMLLMVR